MYWWCVERASGCMGVRGRSSCPTRHCWIVPPATTITTIDESSYMLIGFRGPLHYKLIKYNPIVLLLSNVITILEYKRTSEQGTRWGQYYKITRFILCEEIVLFSEVLNIESIGKINFWTASNVPCGVFLYTLSLELYTHLPINFITYFINL